MTEDNLINAECVECGEEYTGKAVNLPVRCVECGSPIRIATGGDEDE
jgi:predicted Zn-ribbon and HTH transcriptional regulator